MKGWLRIEPHTDLGTACLVTVSPGDLEVEIEDDEARDLLDGKRNVVFALPQTLAVVAPRHPIP